MEISISKIKVLKGILLGILLVSASITVIFFRQNLLLVIFGYLEQK
jgi:hypothetical protein